MSRQVLIVEDDEYKALDIFKTLESLSGGLHIERAASVTTALRAISRQSYDIVVLDMSLPTFDISGPGGGGSPEGQGGIEVLRLAKRLKNRSPVVIVTQYPDIDINGRDVPLEEAAGELTRMFGVTVMGCFLYEFDNDSWRTPLVKAIVKSGGGE